MGLIIGIIGTVFANASNIWYYWLLLPLPLSLIGGLIGWTIYLMQINFSKNKELNKKGKK